MKPSVEHPEIEVHTFHSLGRATGISPTGLAYLYHLGRIEVLCSRIDPGMNLLVLTKIEIKRLTEPRLRVSKYTTEAIAFLREERSKGVLYKNLVAPLKKKFNITSSKDAILHLLRRTK